MHTMDRRPHLARASRLAVALGTLLVFAPAARGDGGPGWWPSFRGPNARGVADDKPLPTTWNLARGENIRFQTPLSGLGHSSPVIWGDRLFLTTAVSGAENPELKVGLYGNIEPVNDETPHSFRVLCLDRNTGAILWDREAFRGVPKIKRHPKATHANSTAATDGRYVIAFFGSEGLYCFDIDGNPKWRRDLGVLDSGYYVVPAAQWEFGSSPVIHGEHVLVQCDVQKGSFVAALSLQDGSDAWRTPRDEVPTWSTPTVHVGPERRQVICNGFRHAAGYDLDSGKELWHLTGGGDIPVPTPVVADDLVFLTNAHGRLAPIYAIKLGATGDITPTNTPRDKASLAWWQPKGGNYMQTPLVYRDLLYMCRDNGVLTCHEARTGAEKYGRRLGGGWTGFTASAVAGDGKVYLTAETGEIHVLRAGPEYDLLATNEMGEICMATPAIADGTIYVRTDKHLVAIAAGSPGASKAPDQK
jgi:outer membrane protein assembly factor BamB